MKKKCLRDYYILIILAFAIVLEAYDTFFAVQNMPLYSSAITPNIVLKGIEDLTEPTEDEILASLNSVDKYNYLLKNYPIIAHAGGTIDGTSYSNSLEALENSYNNGIRIIEVDISLTEDGKAVLTHGFEEMDYKYKMGLKYDKKNPVMSHKEFMNSKLFGKYTPVDIDILVDFMKKHNDVYIIPDIKKGDSSKVVKATYKQIINSAKNDSAILDRVVWTFLSNKVYKSVKNLYDFKIKNIHNRTSDKIERDLNNIDKLILFCNNNNFNTITMSRSLYTEEIAYKLNNSGINVILFTSDSKRVITNLLDYGVTAIMSNKVTKK